MSRVSLTGGGVLALVGVAAAAYVIWKGSRLAAPLVDAAGEALQAVNPTNRDNIFYSGVNSVGAAVSGDKDWSLGGWIYDITHPGELDWLNPAPATQTPEEWQQERSAYAATDPRRVDVPATSDYGAAFGIYPRP